MNNFQIAAQEAEKLSFDDQIRLLMIIHARIMQKIATTHGKEQARMIKTLASFMEIFDKMADLSSSIETDPLE